MITTRQFDKLNRLMSIGNQPGGSGVPPLSFNYAYSSANQRARTTLADGSYWVISSLMDAIRKAWLLIWASTYSASQGPHVLLSDTQWERLSNGQFLWTKKGAFIRRLKLMCHIGITRP